MTAVPSVIPLYPEHPSAKRANATAPLYPSLREYRDARDALLAKLEARFPLHFSTQGQPWAIGIREPLIKAYRDEYPEALIGAVLYHFTHSVRYLTNCVLSGVGADRLTLTGKKAGTVSRREMVFALTQLSGQVSRREPEQARNYREWAMREMVLGLVRGDLTPQSLAKTKVRNTVIRRAVLLAEDEASLDELKLRNQRTGELHPSVYAMPYLPTNLQWAFHKRHPSHITARKLKTKAKAKAKPRQRREEAPKARQASSAKPSGVIRRESETIQRPVIEVRDTVPTVKPSAAPKGPRVIVKRRRRLPLPKEHTA